MNNTFNIDVVKAFNEDMREWIVKYGDAKMLDSFDKKMQFWLPKGPPLPPTIKDYVQNFLIITFILAIFLFAIVGFIGAWYHLGIYLVG